MKYPIGIQTFEQIINNDYIYVDKTELIYRLVNEGKIYFLSRPRRFGKSLLISTLESYFLGKRELFKGLALEKREQAWKSYPVFHIDFNGDDYRIKGTLENALDGYLSRWEREYDVTEKAQSPGRRFCNILEAAHRKTGMNCVVLIDEYDKPVLDVMDQNYTISFQGKEITLEEHHRNILKGFYSTFKAADRDLRFVFLTGVTKFSQVSVFSGFNQPDDISMSPQYETLCGITQEELYRYFDEPIRSMAEQYGYSEEEMKETLEKQYDGYHFSDNMIGIYNPFSILSAMKTQRLQDYWFKTGTPTYLVRLLNHFHENLNELTGKYYSPEEFADYKADMECPLPMIYQSGYLTIKRFDWDMGTFLLDFPNNEVKRGFLTLIANNYLETKEGVECWTREAVIALKQGHLDRFRTLLTSFLASIPYTMRRKKEERERERYFHYTFYLLLRLISVYTIYTEKQQSQGRVDCIIETKDFIYIFEFKLDGTADEALRQIEEKGYARPYLSDTRKLYKIGISFSSETGTVEEWKQA